MKKRKNRTYLLNSELDGWRSELSRVQNIVHDEDSSTTSVLAGLEVWEEVADHLDGSFILVVMDNLAEQIDIGLLWLAFEEVVSHELESRLQFGRKVFLAFLDNWSSVLDNEGKFGSYARNLSGYMPTSCNQSLISSW